MEKRIIKKLKQLKAQNKKIYLWIRDDDAGLKSKQLYDLLSFFDINNCPLLVCVIPHLLTRETTDRIKQYKNVFVGQHGYSHVDYSSRPSIHSELTIERDCSEMYSQQKLGNLMLEKAFEAQYVHVYIPPYFEIDTEVENNLDNGTYQLFSIWWKNELTVKGTPELNAQIDFVNWDEGEFYAGDEFVNMQFLRELDDLENSDDDFSVIGIVLHHKAMNENAYEKLESILSYSHLDNVEVVDCLTAAKILKESWNL